MSKKDLFITFLGALISFPVLYVFMVIVMSLDVLLGY